MEKVLVIVGPTAVGKTALSIELAKTFSAEIISGDSMQIYKGMNIGTGKVLPDEMEGIPHYMIDIKEPHEAFSVAEFKQLVEGHIAAITKREKLPIIVGGTGLYIQSVLYDYDFSERKRDKEITKRLESFVKEQGVEPLYEKLKEIDPVQAKKIHPNNYRRVIRALEVYESTGMTLSEYHQSQTKYPAYNYLIIGLERDRDELYEKINNRVDQMIANGLVDEVNRLYNLGYKDAQSMKAIGYKELIPYFEGEQSLDQSIQLLKRNTRRYAKRQFTWFKNKMNVEWYNITRNRPEKIENIKQRVHTFMQS